MKNIFAEKTSKRILLFLYCLVIVYFMFFSFDRIERLDSYPFSFKLYGIPLWIPKHLTLDIIENWIFSLGNLIAFVPFGVFLPITFSTGLTKYWRALIVFIAGITIMELLQMATLLGSFDVADIVINTLGFSVGFLSWKISQKTNGIYKQMIVFVIAVCIFILMCLFGAEFLNPLFFRR